MSEQEIKVPDLGGADEVEVIEIIVSEGDSVAEEDPILTVESDKASVELPAPAAGKIAKITVKVGDKVREGDVVGVMAADGDAGSAEQSAPAEEPEEKVEAAPEEPKPAPKKSGGSRKEIIRVPSLDGMENVPVIEVNVSEGDTIEAESALVTVESDKATMEVPSPYAGKVGKILVKEGDKVSEGDELVELTIEEEGGEESPAAEPEKPAASEQPAQPSAKPEAAPQPQGSTYEPPAPGTKVHAGPAVRKLARELGADLTRVKGS
ncbi:MAG: dihydrolipoamide acetyltransferase, partial [Gammaproteobacteria bacterium]